MKRKILAAVLSASMVLTMLVGCGKGSDTSNTSDKATNTRAENQILFSGSSTIAPIMQGMASSYFEKYKTWNKVDSKLPDKNIQIYVSSGGSGQGTAALIDGTTDFGMVARDVKPEEKKKIKDEKEYQIGIDALTIAVNPKNPIVNKMKNFTKQQIVDLFSGKYAKWSDLDASLPNKDVVVITRDLNGGAHEVFQQKIMGDAQVTSKCIQASTMSELVSDIINNEYAIGYASYGVANQNKGKVVPISVDGVSATEANITSGKYPIQRPLLLVVSGKLSDEESAFMKYVQGAEGQKTVSSLGFIPMGEADCCS
ncbi:MAG: phosphate ABC transporter substrate-binding protein [Lachnospiraceae bacterium]|jgi:phosphate transport system substrate-binding protein|nr:phosphate ABC transporter substrate-binding protein [Lachnospiraceae bacterium]